MNMKDEIKSITNQLISWRRELHRCPETAHKEHRTAEFLKNALQNLGLEVSSAGGTGLKTVLTGRPEREIRLIFPKIREQRTPAPMTAIWRSCWAQPGS